jgi:prefoldin subunit 5
MNHTDSAVVPIWTLSTSQQSIQVPAVADHGTLTPERLTELRSALATFASAPLVTLEAHPLAKKRNRSAGLPLDAVSPLAQALSRLVAANAKSVPAVAQVAQSSEALYRMVVPAKVAAEVGKGLVKPMSSKAVAGGIHGSLVGAKGIAANATFVPVKAAAAGAATGTAAGAVAAMTVAAPLVLLAVAVGASAYADHQRQKAIERITELLEQLHDDKLERERNELDGCRDAIDKATGLLLDRGKVGASLGLDSAVHAISTAIQNADRRVKKWEAALDSFAGDRVEVSELEAKFPGVGDDGGTFRTHLELAALAIALKRRVIILQGVEAAQSDPDNQFENFVRSLKTDQQRILELEARIDQVLRRLSELQVRTPNRLIDRLMTHKQVDELLETSYRLRALGEGVGSVAPDQEVVIEIEKHSDGTLLVLPARAA